MRRARFWLRWSLRDLRRRWLVVTAISLTVAIGTGAYTGLGSLDDWRRVSNDESFRLMRLHDLHVGLGEGSFVGTGALAAAARSIPSAESLDRVEERLVVPTQVEARGGGEPLLVPGRLVGVPVADEGPGVDRVLAREGRELRETDEGQRVALVEASFAEQNGLPATGTVRVSGGRELRSVGLGISPEYAILPGQTAFVVSHDYGILFVPVSTAQSLSGHVGEVNDLVLTLVPGADRDGVERELEAALAERLPAVATTIETRDETDAYRILYDDIEGDQQIYTTFALLLLVAGTFAAFNLASRIVEAQRREIGVGMALGVAPRTIAIRPLLLGVEIGVLGVLLGIPLGIAIGRAFLGVYERAIPLPVWQSPFQASTFLVGATLGLGLPILATAYPTWRAVRAPPLAAMEHGYRAARGGGLAPLLARLPTPGGSFARMPVRDVVRAPRRTLLTVLGIAAAITTVTGATGMVDSFRATMEQSDRVLVDPRPERITVRLATIAPAGAPGLEAITSGPLVEQARPALEVGATVRAAGDPIDVLLGVVDAGSPVWRPAVSEGGFEPGAAGIVLTEEAASDLDVGVGDTVVLRHPFLAGPSAFGARETSLEVIGLHPNPIRVFAYVDASQAQSLGVAGLVNVVDLVPREGVDPDEVKRALFEFPHVAAVQPVVAVSESFDKALSQLADILRITELAALALALLISFNGASINADERAREHATMFAFGVRTRTVLGMAMLESLFTAVAGTAIGIGLGVLVVKYVTSVLTPRVLPEVGTAVSIAPSTVVLAVVIGVVAATLAPLLTARRLRRMDVPSTLRLVE